MRKSYEDLQNENESLKRTINIFNECHREMVVRWEKLFNVASRGDYANGNTDPTGSIDEGSVRTYEMLEDMKSEMMNDPMTGDELKKIWDDVNREIDF